MIAEKPRGVRIGTDVNFFSTKKCLSRVTIQSVPATMASFKTFTSSESRHVSSRRESGIKILAFFRRSSTIAIVIKKIYLCNLCSSVSHLFFIKPECGVENSDSEFRVLFFYDTGYPDF